MNDKKNRQKLEIELAGIRSVKYMLSSISFETGDNPAIPEEEYQQVLKTLTDWEIRLSEKK